MILKNINHGFSYHTEKIATMFFPLEKIGESGDGITVITKKEDNTISVFADVFGVEAEKSETVGENEDMAQAMSLLLFDVLSDITGFKPPWGILYGVRPARLMHSKYEELGEDGAVKFFKDSLADERKIKLAHDVMKSENEIIKLSKDNSYSLYVSIPFCPSRCAYCSFVSHSVENAGELIEKYVELLCAELEDKARIAKTLGLRLETIYFGGGTPTSLTAEQLERIIVTIENNFDLSELREYTVEAGRPDTVTGEKLEVMKSHGVGRISVNPQTFSDEVREKAGRKHTTVQTLEAFELAREAGFKNINMDFIAGLESDTLENFKMSIYKAVELGCESITVHNLSLKSAAFLVTEKKYYDLSEKVTADKMIEYSSKKLRESGYHPYYMYRQSKSLGNLENVGWCKDGYECLYNVFMMDETHTVFAVGAGAVTKLKNPRTGHIERIYNFKYPYEYVKDFEKIIERGKGIIDFYGA